MDDNDFLLAQFSTLREEIKETKARIYRTLGFGITAVPTAHYLAQSYNIDILAITLPILVLVVGLMYLSENHSLMRCGRYIREQIESHTNVIGWEEWLSTPDIFKKRAVDIFLFYSFYILFLMYYMSSLFLTAKFCIEKYSKEFSIIIIIIYIVLGILSAIFFFWNRMISTTTASMKSK